MIVDRIKVRVHDLMKSYGVYDKNLEKEFLDYCLKEYEMQVAGGLSKDEAKNVAIAKIEKSIKDRVKPKNKYLFAIIFSATAFFLAIIEALMPMISPYPLTIYNYEIIIIVGLCLVLLIYCAISWRSRYWYDFVVLLIFLVIWIVSFAQVSPYSLHASMPRTYWSAEYVFPCVVKVLTYRSPTSEPINYTLTHTTITVNLNLLVSFIAFVVFVTLFVLNKRRNIKK